MKKQMSLQWRLTYMTALLVTVACLSLNYLVSSSAVFRMDEIGDSVVNQLALEVFPSDGEETSEPTSFYIDITDLIQDTKTGFRLESLLATLLIAVVSSAATYFTVGGALRPLKQLEQQTANIQANNLSSPITVRSGSREITGLTAAFNKMLTRLNDTFFILQQFSSNAAHELRTPLAMVQTKIEVLQKQEDPTAADYTETLNAVRGQANRLSHVIDVLLEMTELHTVPVTEKLSLAAITEEVFCDLTDLGEKQGISLVQVPGDATVCGSDPLIYRAVYNLVENAIKYNRRGGSVTVEIGKENGYAKLQVTDTGIGINESDRTRIFEPFYRADKSRSRAMGGAGLGLALVNDIAVRHGGAVHVRHTSPEGTEFVLLLPLMS